MTFFAYHWGLQAVCAAGLDGKPIVVPARTLRDAGWHADDADLRLILPRADPSVLETAKVMPPGLKLKPRR